MAHILWLASPTWPVTSCAPPGGKGMRGTELADGSARSSNPEHGSLGSGQAEWSHGCHGLAGSEVSKMIETSGKNDPCFWSNASQRTFERPSCMCAACLPWLWLEILQVTRLKFQDLFIGQLDSGISPLKKQEKLDDLCWVDVSSKVNFISRRMDSSWIMPSSLLAFPAVTQDMGEARMKEIFQKFGNVVSVKLAKEAAWDKFREGDVLKSEKMTTSQEFLDENGELMEVGFLRCEGGSFWNTRTGWSSSSKIRAVSDFCFKKWNWPKTCELLKNSTNNCIFTSLVGRTSFVVPNF